MASDGYIFLRFVRIAGFTQLIKNTTKILEWAGTLTGLLGAFLLAIAQPYSGFGWIAFLISNLFWIAFSLKIKANGLLLMQLGFTATSLIGLINSFF